jgi:hypothetical protein
VRILPIATAALGLGLAASCGAEPRASGSWGGGDDESGGIVVPSDTGSEEGGADGSSSGEGGSGSTTGVDQGSTSSASTASASETGEGTGSPSYPVAEEDRYVITTDALPLEVDAAEGVLANDQAGDDGPLEVTSFQARTSSGGFVDVSPSGSFTYMAADGFTGEDRFFYTVTDVHGGTDMGTVRIVVLG